MREALEMQQTILVNRISLRVLGYGALGLNRVYPNTLLSSFSMLARLNSLYFRLSISQEIRWW